ncbi:alpha/beta fold hydrolase [Blastococcus atacamensis]|uniref:alpha/beta fold hydrolase n=1 Tax=Blastococcus atacamensis TaxID=2070508 RepID=UPI000CEC8F35|nr:alpha/beta hydrolase [Blastococcus atacamensis]
MGECEVVIEGRAISVREAGDPKGSPVLYFHGTPGSRLDLDFGDQAAGDLGVRLISFDRPGYGRSDPAPFGLRSVAEDGREIADRLGLDRLAAFGWSGGGPFALAAAAVMGERVSAVGVASGPGPFQQVPGAMEKLEESDRVALSFLPDEPARAAEQFCVGAEMMVAFRDDEQTFMSGMDALFGDTDADVLADPSLRHHLFAMVSEGLRQGAGGGGWDNVAWLGPWDVDLAVVRCPVRLWYGERDSTVPVSHGEWLADHLSDAHLVVYSGEGHMGPMRHLPQMLTSLTR